MAGRVPDSTQTHISTTTTGSSKQNAVDTQEQSPSYDNTALNAATHCPAAHLVGAVDVVRVSYVCHSLFLIADGPVSPMLCCCCVSMDDVSGFHHQLLVAGGGMATDMFIPMQHQVMQ